MCQVFVIQGWRATRPGKDFASHRLGIAAHAVTSARKGSLATGPCWLGGTRRTPVPHALIEHCALDPQGGRAPRRAAAATRQPASATAHLALPVACPTGAPARDGHPHVEQVQYWLKNRTRFATLNGLDMRPEQHEEPTTFVINTALPPEVLRRQRIDEDGPGELEAGEAG